MKVALVHDFIKEYGGAERVLESLHEIYPDAPIYTAWANLNSLGPHKKRFQNWQIRKSWAKYLPFFSKLLSPYRIFAPLFFASFDFSGYDLVISSSSPYFGKGIITKPNTLHISYCHTPPRFLYGYPTAIDWKKHWFGKIFGSLANHFLRIYDFWSAQRVDYFIANSHEVEKRINKFYRRKAEVIYPPVDINKFKVNLRPELRSRESEKLKSEKDYFLCVSRLARSKRVDIAIDAANKLKLKLKIVGDGKERKSLEKIAGKTVQFLGEAPDDELVKLYQNCQAVIFCAEEEDLGLVPIEANAAGKPVIAYASGGTLETIILHTTGEFFVKPTAESLISVLEHFEPKKYNPDDCIKQAEKFSKERFKKEIIKFVEDKIK